MIPNIEVNGMLLRNEYLKAEEHEKFDYKLLQQSSI